MQINHHTHIFRIFSANDRNQPESINLLAQTSIRIERENCIIEHAKKYRVGFPEASHLEMYGDYKKTCPRSLQYAITKWKKIIKDHQLDPRSPKEKRKKAGRPPINHP